MAVVQEVLVLQLASCTHGYLVETGLVRGMWHTLSRESLMPQDPPRCERTSGPSGVCGPLFSTRPFPGPGPGPSPLSTSLRESPTGTPYH